MSAWIKGSMLLFSIGLFTLGIFAWPTPDAPTMRLGTNVWPGYEPLYLARDLELYPPKSVKLVEYHSASEVLRAFRNKSIEAAALTLDEVLVLLEYKVPVRLVLVTDISHGGDVIVAKPEIETIADLRSKRVGVEGNALGAYVLSRALDLHGIDLTTLKVVQLEVSQHEKAFNDGTIDAVVTFEPVRSKLLNVGAKEIFTSRDIPDEIVDVIVVHEDVLKQYPDQVAALINGWFAALEHFRDHPEDAADRMTGRLGMEPNEILESFSGLKLPSREDHATLMSGDSPALIEIITRLQKVMLDTNLLKEPVNIDGLLVPEVVLGAR